MLGQRAYQTCRVLAAIALGGSGCSLIAPDDEHFVGGSGGSGASDAGTVERCDPAPPCSTPSGPATTTVAAGDAALHTIVASANAGDVIELSPGTYSLGQPLVFAKDGVTLRSSTGNPGDVTVNGQNYPGVVEINASNITLSGFTLTNATETGVMGTVGIAVIPPEDARIVGTRICNMVVRNAGGEHFMNVLRTPSPTKGWADCGLIEGSSFVLDGTPAAAACAVRSPNGVTVSAGWGWVVRGNAFGGFTCPPGDPADPATTCKGPPFAVVFSDGSRDTALENNCIVAAGRAFGFGMEQITAVRSYPDQADQGEQLSHVDGVIRNNVIFGGDCYDTGIELNYARRPQVVHNTVVAGVSLNYAGIDARFAASDVFVWNNLVTGGVRCRECGKLDADVNVDVAIGGLATVFVDPAALDFHLLPGASAAIDTGAALEVETGVDLDGEPHEVASPDVGADELGTVAADPLTPCQRLLPAAAR